MKRFSSLFLFFLMLGCVRLPDNITPVDHFELSRYLGKWYEIARLDHSFERGLSHVTAEYNLRQDGGVRVVNHGYAARENKWKQAEGKAFFVKGPGTGFLKVSFFGPFYGSYIVVDLDRQNYQYSLVCGPDRSYLWILARTPVLDPAVKNKLIDKASALGFDTRKLIFVDQNNPPAAR